MQGTGEVVAVERHPQRARALQATGARMRAANVTVATAKCQGLRRAARFDRVLLDPPCSGLGTLRSHPDLRWRTSPEAIERLAAEQDALLASARRALAPGGTLVYSVCTLSPREERLVTDAVQRTFPHLDGTDGSGVLELAYGRALSVAAVAAVRLTLLCYAAFCAVLWLGATRLGALTAWSLGIAASLVVAALIAARRARVS